jgi:hypothetical protein
MGLVVKVVVDDPTRRDTTGGRSLAEEAAQ